MEHKHNGKGELLIAGVGGWGIVTIGDILAKAALKEYENTLARTPIGNASLKSGVIKMILGGAVNAKVANKHAKLLGGA
ncbi:MAG: hypothetical protein SVY10_02345, partial [Thermodesulfobacteriota bacterium]|nr:hypothetical protein [Thermodesulfobacteriota bacterium]